MATQMIVPILGESIQEATLTRWLKTAGEPVRRGEEIAEIETAKASLALECPANGVLLAIHAPEGSLVGAGDLLAWIGQPGEEVGGEKVGKTGKAHRISRRLQTRCSRIHTDLHGPERTGSRARTRRAMGKSCQNGRTGAFRRRRGAWPAPWGWISSRSSRPLPGGAL